ncbi:MAG: DUF2304 family protein [Candidatus Woesearchaeota archaeon]|jgi:hypothetical protein
MELFQYLLILFVLFVTSRVFLQFKDKKIGVGQFLFWLCLWLVVLLFGIFFPYLWFVSNILGISRLADVFVYGSIAFLFYLMYRIYMKIESLEQEITKLTRAIAFENDKYKVKKK